MELSKLAKMFKALSNEQRLKLFQMLYKGFGTETKINTSCCEGFRMAFTHACECMDLSRSTISHHFKELQGADLIHCTRVGQTFECKVNKEAIDQLKDFLA